VVVDLEVSVAPGQIAARAAGGGVADARKPVLVRINVAK